MRVSEGKTFGGETREMPPLWGEGRLVPARCFNKTGRMAVICLNPANRRGELLQPRKPESLYNGVHLEIGSRQIVLPEENKKGRAPLHN